MAAEAENPQTVGGSADPDALGTDAREAVRAWAREIRGAPRHFDEMVYLLKQEEEIFVRVATEIHRREVVVQRAPAERGQAPSGLMRAPRTIDPWAIGPDDLRACTEDTEACAGCGGRGTEACRGCGGSGVEKVWLTYTNVARIDVRTAAGDPLVALHPQLREPRILAKSDLAPFTILAAALASGVVPSGALSYDEFERLQEASPPVERRERVSQQQYLRFAAVRRELGYDMCGARATLVLSGAKFAVEVTPESLAPIRRRMRVWSAATVVVVLLTAAALLELPSSASYFTRSNRWLELFIVVAGVGSVPLLGALVRAVGPRFKPGRLWAIEKLTALLVIGALGGVVAVKSTVHPRAAEAREYLAAGDFTRANEVLRALDAIHAEPGAVSEIRDEMAYAAAIALAPDARLAKLDEIAARGGARAADAAQSARKERTQNVVALIDQQKLKAALALIDQGFGDPRTDEATRQEMRARVYDAEFAQCASDPCRFVSARKAERAMPTPTRASRTTGVRSALALALTTADVPGESTLARLRRLRLLEATAQSVAAVSSTDDGELTERAKSAAKFAVQERERVPFLGSDRATLEDLVGQLDEKLHASIEGVAVYVSMDRAGRCTGVYVVGETAAARKEGLKSEYLPALIVTRALGRPATLRRPANGDATTTRWTDGAVPIVARWRQGALVEIRIGAAFVGVSLPPKPRPQKPGKLPLVSVVAFPGGEILIDGVGVGLDATPPLKVKPGKHEVKVRNRFLGENAETFDVKDEGKTAVITVVW